MLAPLTVAEAPLRMRPVSADGRARAFGARGVSCRGLRALCGAGETRAAARSTACPLRRTLALAPNAFSLARSYAAGPSACAQTPFGRKATWHAAGGAPNAQRSPRDSPGSTRLVGKTRCWLAVCWSIAFHSPERCPPSWAWRRRTRRTWRTPCRARLWTVPWPLSPPRRRARWSAEVIIPVQEEQQQQRTAGVCGIEAEKAPHPLQLLPECSDSAARGDT